MFGDCWAMRDSYRNWVVCGGYIVTYDDAVVLVVTMAMGHLLRTTVLIPQGMIVIRDITMTRVPWVKIVRYIPNIHHNMLGDGDLTYHQVQVQGVPCPVAPILPTVQVLLVRGTACPPVQGG